MLATSNSPQGRKQTARRRTNKNKKKNWRKNIDTSAVEKALDEKNLELRTGGLVSDKSDIELFFVDKSSTTEYKSKSERLKQKRLRQDEILLPDPKAVKPARELSKRAKKHATKTAEKKIYKRKAVQESGEQTQSQPYDLWSKDTLELHDKIWKKNKVMKFTDEFIGKRQMKRPKHLLNKPNDVEGYKYRNVPAIEVAHPGASYNPTFDDHQTLLAKALEVEVGKERLKEKITRALHVPHDQLLNHGEREQELEEGLFGHESDDDKVDGMGPVIANAPVRAADRKTRRKRRMEEKEKREKERREKVWGDKLRENEVFRTKTYLADIRAKEKRLAARRELRSKKLRMLRLSNVKFTEPDIELKLSEEIKGSLRELKPEPGLFNDRYKSFQKRGIVEPRCKRRVPKRKYKVKYQEKRQWREIEI